MEITQKELREIRNQIKLLMTNTQYLKDEIDEMKKKLPKKKGVWL